MNEHKTSQVFNLDPESELRFEVNEKDEKVTLELKNGLAEVFGAELIKGKKYEFGFGHKIGVFTWQGCTVEFTGKTVAFVEKKTPMALYLNCHAALERMREFAEKDNSTGPIVMIAGPQDVGKSTLTKIFLNYAARMGRRPTFVDLDVGQGQITIPGIIGALPIDKPSDVVDGFNTQGSVGFHFGHKGPGMNMPLYNHLVSRIAEVCSDRMEANKKEKAGGIIINTCGWILKKGYRILTHIAQAFEVDVIIVLDHEKLYNALVKDIPDFVKVILLPKSSGVVNRGTPYRRITRNLRIDEYYYGTKRTLTPHSFDVKWSDVKIFSVGPLSNSQEVSKNKATKLIPVVPGPNLKKHILSISLADPNKDDIVQTNIAGFVCITNVDVAKQTMTILSPLPGPLPNNVLLLSSITYPDDK
ncbi:Similar to CLP1: Polyribonucleotide 5'-hydroxyl-kinase Clp1 (Gallus gallus) [Cotesia congregata]|uniref:Protein CLP1 homolog n=1 Tax=Cotesia congregata TaxID=51543 RepID=A0A8J2MZG7_COTCN|nr:Similar to CLP1: Polyribonucleotide 5'-hydroxyl-kinase Clp1 (Gallus gallus) [Cotesia congregata]